MKLASSDQPLEYFVLKLDGHARSKHRRFVDALKAGLQLKNEFPNHEIEVRGVTRRRPDAGRNASDCGALTSAG
jgi:hypothetical protein